jgi:alkaline phosphatase
MVMTPTTVVIGEPNPGNHYAPANSLLNGTVGDHKSGQAPLALNECGFPIDFSPLDYMTEGGSMVLWDDVLGGEFPWDERYYQESPDTSTGFDPLYIMQHATDSAPTAGCMATGHKAAVDMLSQNLYEEDVSTLVEDAMYCGKAGGVVTSVPMFHATPGAFIIHSNSRSDRDQLRRSFEKVNPTFVSGVCGGDYYPYPETLESMRSGALSSQWTLLEQKNVTMAEVGSDVVLLRWTVGDMRCRGCLAHLCFEMFVSQDFYAGEEFTLLDPDNGDHVMVCLGGDWTPSGQDNLPYRGVDSSYTNRVCSGGEEILDPDSGIAIGINPTGTICNHYTPEEVDQIPHITDNVKAALDFLSKDDDGFFMMYEQGDVSHGLEPHQDTEVLWYSDPSPVSISTD